MAERQHGVVAAHQLYAIGYTKRMLYVRVRTGRLHRLYRGVYAVGRRQLNARGRWMAAALAYGPSAVISHRTAAALLEIRPSDQLKVDVTVPHSRRCRPNVRAHTAVLSQADITRRDGIPVTTIPRTLVDLAAVLDHDRLLRAVEQADRMHRLNVRTVKETAARIGKRKGIPALVRILNTYAGAPVVRSELERDFLDLVRTANLPEPQVNAKIAGLEVDFFWPEHGLAVELDGRGYHTSPRAFETDRIRDARLLRAGVRPLRITHHRLHNYRDQVLTDVLALMRPRA